MERARSVEKRKSDDVALSARGECRGESDGPELSVERRAEDVHVHA